MTILENGKISEQTWKVEENELISIYLQISHILQQEVCKNVKCFKYLVIFQSSGF